MAVDPTLKPQLFTVLSQPSEIRVLDSTLMDVFVQKKVWENTMGWVPVVMPLSRSLWEIVKDLEDSRLLANVRSGQEREFERLRQWTCAKTAGQQVCVWWLLTHPSLRLAPRWNSSTSEK